MTPGGPDGQTAKGGKILFVGGHGRKEAIFRKLAATAFAVD
jgi:hypothetical protein